MITPTILLVLAHQGYQATEYGVTRSILENAGFIVKIASNRSGTAHSMPLGVSHPYDHVTVDIDISEVKASDYQGIFLIGGSGTLQALDTIIVHQFMNDAHEHNVIIGAICIAPRILAKAGILANKSATGWDGDHKLESLLKKYKVKYLNKPVIIDGAIITAKDPFAAEEFGKTIVEMVKAHLQQHNS